MVPLSQRRALDLPVLPILTSIHSVPSFGHLRQWGLWTTGGQLQLVLMRPTPQLSVKTCGGGGGAVGAGGGRREGGGIGSSAGGVPRGGGCARPTTTTCIPQRCVCVWGHGGIEVCMR